MPKNYLTGSVKPYGLINGVILPGPGLDAYVAKAMGHYKYQILAFSNDVDVKYDEGPWMTASGDIIGDDLPHYSTDIGTAMNDVWPKLGEFRTLYVAPTLDLKGVTIWASGCCDNGRSCKGLGETEAHAICLAFVKMKEVE